MPTLKLTKQNVERIKHPDKGQVIYWDETLKGFGLRVTPGAKVYVVQGRDKTGKDCRAKIGAHGPLTAEQARVEAKQKLAMLADGINVNTEKAKDKATTITLAEVFEKYKQSRSLRPTTLNLYEGAMRRCFSDWSDKPISAISKDMVEKRHKSISTANGPRGEGKAHANQAMRFLRSLFNYAASVFEDADGKALVTENPVKRLSQVKAWNRVERRQTVIHRHQLPAWFAAVNKLVQNEKDDPLMRDYLVLLILTGLRRNEAAKLKWTDIDFYNETLTITAEGAKNHQEHRLPLSDYLVELLKRRDGAKKDGAIYVFPGDGKNGHLVESKWSVAKVATSSGVKFSPHDLRRTFLTIAEGLDVPHYALKKLANHRDNSDVTSGYIVSEVKRLKEPMQQITDFILESAEVTKPAKAKPKKKEKAKSVTRMTSSHGVLKVIEA